MLTSRAAAFLLGSVSFLAIPALAATVWPAHPQTSAEITAADLSARDKAISDDAFEGRGPGTPAGEASAQWIADDLKRMGIAPGNHGSYFQTVPAVNIALDRAKSTFTFNTSQGAITPGFPDDVTYWTPQYKSADVKVAKSDVVFVGYGIVAPEYNWNDYAGIDVKGKTVVILINDPGNEDASPDPAFFKGKAMTYYGRWTYKYEEAARQGAAAAIIVHETGPAAYPYQVVRSSNSGIKSWLDVADKNASMVPIQGWMTLDVAKDLFKRAGLDYLEQKAAANKPGFHAVPMAGETLDVSAHSTFTRLKTRNVIGIIPGTTHPNDAVIFSAHWDHIGVKPDVAGPDKIYNGAVDNGMGVSQVLELAEKFKADKRPQRTLAFLFWTMEEQGLLGSEYFAEHPLWPRTHIAGVFNLDADGPGGATRDMTVRGNGQSDLEDILAGALVTQGRTMSPDPQPERGGFFRSDHFSLAKVGIPAISAGAGFDMVNGGVAAGKARADEYTAHRYHQPTDEWHADWDLTAATQDALAYYIAGDTLANSDAWPGWKSTSEFKAPRDKDMATKK
ncbi:MAG TPA: M28 family metallopeptidase [Rhizomicrobium sp.]|jgi:Zn-dependent M28 family amino/carboxypeptidase|nr:M28 family metallopeptidase [Rhizomicrobium sp.]